MARYYQPITVQDFEDKIRAQVIGKPAVLDEYTPEELEGDGVFRGLAFAIMEDLFPKITADLSKVDFDFENFYLEPSDCNPGTLEASFLGINTLPNGMVYLGCMAGGDWENPLLFVIYWSGKEFRAYLPEAGNSWNTATRTAYGSEPRGQETNSDNWPDADLPVLIADIQARIQLKP